LLKKAGALNYWTRYSVKYENGGLVTWKEFYGDNPLTEETGQLLPVIDIVQTLPKVLNPGDRYWVSDGGINLITTIGVGKDENGVATLSSRSLELKEGVSVRVKSKGYKSYLILDGELITYDEIDCGTYDNSAV
jgi:hypothetical protein